MTVIAQVAVADVAATIAIPFVLAPARAAHVAAGTLLIAGCVIAIFALARSLPGLMVAALGGPKRLSTEVLGADGFFVPLFFVVLGARVDLRGLAEDPAMIGPALALAGLTAAVHLLAARVMRQPPAAGLLASAQLGVPAAIVALGLSEHVITSTPGSGDRHRFDDQSGRLQRRGGSADPASTEALPAAA